MGMHDTQRGVASVRSYPYPALNFGFKHLSVASHFSISLTLYDMFSFRYALKLFNFFSLRQSVFSAMPDLMEEQYRPETVKVT